MDTKLNNKFNSFKDGGADKVMAPTGVPMTAWTDTSSRWPATGTGR